MPLTLDDRAVRPLAANEVMRMVEAGILGEDERLELLDGLLTEKPVKSAEHAAVQARLLAWAGQVLDRYDVRTDAPIIVPRTTYLPEPDLAIVERTGEIAHPTTALLVVEVAITSMRTDVEIKPPLYAAAGVAEYWVVDVPGRRLRMFEDPAGEEYRKERVLEEGAAAPRSFDVEPLELGKLFEGL